MLRRTFALSFVAAFVIVALPAVAQAVSVHVRVEGKTTTIFGATDPLLTPFTGALAADGGSMVDVSRPTALGALEAASIQGEFFYRLVVQSFGPFVSQIGRYPGAGSSGWVYKVNGVSPPVGADAYVVKDGDDVLWYYATFGETGGPKTLDLTRAGKGCFRAFEVDDTGARVAVRDVVFRLDSRNLHDRDGLLCPTGHWQRIRVTKDGEIRSQVLLAR